MATLITTGPLFGMVLVAGGHSDSGGADTLVSAELYDPSTGLWTETGSMAIARYFDNLSSATLPNGSILIVGGTTCCPYHWFNEAELFDPVSQTWTATSAKMTYAQATTVLLPNDLVLVAGGVRGTAPTSQNVADAELFDSATGTWTATAEMSTDRDRHTLTLLGSGQALVAGGASGGLGVCNDLTSAELYDSAAGTWFPTGNMTVARLVHMATLLPNVQVLVAGGIDCEGNFRSSAELYTPPDESTTCLPPPAGLVSWWSGDKTAEDLQGANPGVLKNGATFRKGKVGPAFLFDGIDDYVQIPHDPSLNPGRSDFSVGFWINTDTSDNLALVNKREAWGPVSFWSMAMDQSGLIAVELYEGGSSNNFTFFLSDIPVNDGAWHHVALVRQTTTATLYIDGAVHGSSSTENIINVANTFPVLVATDVCVGLGRQVYNGELDEIEYLDVALTSSQVQDIYNAGSAGQCKPEIFVSSITPSYEVVGHLFLISTSIVIQDENGVGIEGASVQIKAILPSGSVLAFPVTTDATGQATVSFDTKETGLFKFKVLKVMRVGREYDALLNIETSDTLLIP